MPRNSLRGGMVGASGDYYDGGKHGGRVVEVFLWGGLILEDTVKLSENIYRS